MWEARKIYSLTVPLQSVFYSKIEKLSIKRNINFLVTLKSCFDRSLFTFTGIRVFGFSLSCSVVSAH